MDRDFGKVKWTDEELEARVQEIVASLGGGGGFEPEVLYENLDLTSNFTTREIELPKSAFEYKFLIICFKLSTTIWGFLSTGLVSLVESTVSSATSGITIQGFVYQKGICMRSFSPVKSNPKKISVSLGAKYTNLTGSPANDDSVMIPVRIYGVS